MASAHPLVGLAVIAQSCALVHSVELDPPLSFTKTTSTSIARGSGWWQDLGDPALGHLVDRALDSSASLEGARARVRRIAAEEQIAESGWWPEIDAKASFDHGRRRFTAGEDFIRNFDLTSLELSASLGYDVDAWGRTYSSQRALELEGSASESDAAGTATAIAAAVADVWFRIVEQRLVSDLLDRQTETNLTYLALVEARFQNGEANALDVLQQKQRVGATRAQTLIVSAQEGLLRNRLVALLGEPPPGDVPESRELPGLAPPPAIGVPFEIVGRRPDVVSARMRVVAQDFRVGAAIAAWLPAIRIGGLAGFQSFNVDSGFSDLFESFVYNIGVSISSPVFDGGRRSGEVRRANAVLEEALAHYREVVIRAAREIEDALLLERSQRDYVEEIDRQLEVSRMALEAAKARYLDGLSDYLPVLTALTAVQDLERALVSARREVLTRRVELHRSLAAGEAP